MLLTLKNTRQGSLPGNGCGGFITAIKHPSPGSFIMEIWKDVKGYEGSYQVSNLGRVKGLARIVPHGRCGTCSIKEKVLTPGEHRQGYLMAFLARDRKRKRIYVHRLVAIAFLSNPFNKPTVNHKDGDKSNNKSTNLEWATRSENTIHAYATGLKKPIKNAEHYRSKTVIQLDLSGNFISRHISASVASRELSISKGNISNGCCGNRKTAGGFRWIHE